MPFTPIALSFIVIAVSTYVLFSVLGVSRSTLLFEKSDALRFQKEVSSRFGMIAVVSNIFGTLTSLATVYVFFLGTSKVFGAFILLAPVTVFLGTFATNHLTRIALENRPAFRDQLASAEITTGVIARLVWEPTVDGRRAASLIKWISLCNIASVLWLEISVFGDLAALALDKEGSAFASSSVVLLSSFVIILIIIKYGLRGFVFADILHTPFVVVGTLSVLIGTVLTLFNDKAPLTSAIVIPMASPAEIIAFLIHVATLNIFFVTLTEPHWLRLWLFNEGETAGQTRGTLYTAAVWSVLAFVGMLAVLITHDTGIQGIIPLIGSLDSISPALNLVFWLGASAALFSSADAQIYSLLMVWHFVPQQGCMSAKVERPASPLIFSFVASTSFAVIFFITRYLEVPFEKLVFALFPICLNSLPALIAVATKRRLTPFWTIISLAIYALSTIIGFAMPLQQLTWGLAAAVSPLAVSILMLASQKSFVVREE